MDLKYNPSWNRQYCVTHTDTVLQNPFDDSNRPMTRQFYTGLDAAVEAFTAQINDYLDTGAVQLWELNENNNTWFEMGSLYL